MAVTYYGNVEATREACDYVGDEYRRGFLTFRLQHRRILQLITVIIRLKGAVCKDH